MDTVGNHPLHHLAQILSAGFKAEAEGLEDFKAKGC